MPDEAQAGVHAVIGTIASHSFLSLEEDVSVHLMTTAKAAKPDCNAFLSNAHLDTGGLGETMKHARHGVRVSPEISQPHVLLLSGSKTIGNFRFRCVWLTHLSIEESQSQHPRVLLFFHSSTSSHRL